MEIQTTASHLARVLPERWRGLTTISRSIGAWCWGARDLLSARIERLSAVGRGDEVLQRFAEFLASVDDPGTIETALLRLAYELSGANRVELYRGETLSRPAGVWPLPWLEAESRMTERDAVGLAFRLAIQLQGENWGSLHFFSRRRRLQPRLVRQLTGLGTMAAAAERAARGRGTGGLPTPYDPVTGLYNESFLIALLDHSLRQAHRRSESLTLIALALEPPSAETDPRRPRVSNPALQVAARAVRRTLRESDIVARLNSGILAAALPAAALDHIQLIARALRAAIQEATLATADPGPVSVAIGVASYPTHAHDTPALLAAATAALERDRERVRSSDHEEARVDAAAADPGKPGVN
jgi:diguanylate cyclase (GGDEF)-like protein